jgi:peptidoglycan/LPS O-acetylase OafA/YrhL
MFFMKIFNNPLIGITTTFIVSIVFATISYYLLEKPSIVLGKKIVKLLPVDKGKQKVA